MRKALLAATVLAAGAATPVQAQTSTACQGRAVIDTIYQTGVGGNSYEYFFTIRNLTRVNLTVDVSITGFTTGVTLFSPSLPGIPLGRDAAHSALKFGRGTSGNISVGTVARAYDAAAGSGPTIRLTNCRAG
jgi:hypothetical protein